MRIGRPRTFRWAEAPMEVRIRIARLHGLRYYRLFAERFPQDFNQTVPLIALLAGTKHRTLKTVSALLRTDLVRRRA